MAEGGDSSLVIGRIADPESTIWWTDFKAFLAPAAQRGGVDTLLGPNELLWGVFDAGRPIAAATARLTTDNRIEVVLCGGENHRRWARALAESLADAGREVGAEALRCLGRKGWVRALGGMVVGRDASGPIMELEIK